MSDLLKTTDTTTPLADGSKAEVNDHTKRDFTVIDEVDVPSARKPQYAIQLSDLSEIEQFLVSTVALYQQQRATFVQTGTDIERLWSELVITRKKYTALRNKLRRKTFCLLMLLLEREDAHDRALKGLQRRARQDTEAGTDEDHGTPKLQPSTTTEDQAPWYEEEDPEQRVTCASSTDEGIQQPHTAEPQTIRDLLRKLNINFHHPVSQYPNRSSCTNVSSTNRRNIVCSKCKKKGHFGRECRSPPKQETK
jgi:hypothetical protein